MHLKPAIAQRPQHTHGLNGFGVMQMAGGQLAGLLGTRGGFAQRFFGHGLIQPGQRNQQQSPRRGKNAEPDVEQINHQQVHREPRRIEKREQRRAGDELANMCQIPQRLSRIAFAFEQVALERRPIDPQIEPSLQLTANTDDDETADSFQQTDKGKEPDNHQRQHDQCCFILRRQYPVIDLQHVDRGRQHQNVDQGGKTTDADQDALIVPQCLY
ncbi:hypothetical protein D3C87_1040240 [compost metagenome]